MIITSDNTKGMKDYDNKSTFYFQTKKIHTTFNKLFQYNCTTNEELKTRNRPLIKTIRESLVKEDNFDTFKKLNKNYVNGNDLSAKQFHESSMKLFKRNSFHSILMELLALLPDVKKRVELKNIHETWYFDNQRKENEKIGVQKIYESVQQVKTLKDL